GARHVRGPRHTRRVGPRTGRLAPRGRPSRRILGRAMLYGRTAECAALDRLLVEAQAGRSQVLVLRGEPGIGKTALLDYVAARAAGCRVVRAAGVESEMELTFSGLHQLCGP